VQRCRLDKLKKLKIGKESYDIASAENIRSDSSMYKYNCYPRVVNKTSIMFTNEEIMLLNKGLQYNLHCKNKDWLKI
jgi:hypothetical protein